MYDKEKFYIIRNLKDSGCNKKMIDEYLQIEDEEKQIIFLRKHRKKLLEKYHIVQKQIDSLDYLIYSKEKNKDL